MIFLVSNDPFSALQLQNQLRLAGHQQVDIFLSVEEAEHNLYKLPDMILMDENLTFSNLLYLTQSVKVYDGQMHVIWLCQKDCADLRKLYKGYGVIHCIPKNEALTEELASKVQETLNQHASGKNSNKRMEFLKKNLLNMGS